VNYPFNDIVNDILQWPQIFFGTTIVFYFVFLLINKAASLVSIGTFSVLEIL